MDSKKTCTRCGETKTIDLFPKDKTRKDGHFPQCKSCCCERSKKWGEENKDKVKEYQKLYRTENADILKDNAAKWYLENKELVRRKQSETHERDPTIRRSNNAKRRAADPERARRAVREALRKRRATPQGKLENSISGGMRKAIKRGSKNGRRTFELLGYTSEQLKEHLEKLFLPGMTWKNYGRGGWHIDHKVPLSVFNYETPDDLDFGRAWALSNLQPMWERDNIIKSAKLDKPFQPSLLIATNDNRTPPQKETA